MRLVVQIPCYNESLTLPITLRDLPQTVAGFDEVIILVIDDGSTDGTVEVAAANGVENIVQLPRNRGLAFAFARGLERSLELGADVIVNTDADNQYPGIEIHRLVAPILNGEAEMVIGDRQTGTIAHFSWTKKLLQRVGSWVVRWASGTDVPDATSGFRAVSREAAMRLAIFSGYTYTLETIIQAGKKGIPITSVPISINPQIRKSRLIRSVPWYVARSAGTILRITMMYEALRVFLSAGLILMLSGGALLLRFGYFYAIGEGSGHVQSLIVASIVIVIGFQTMLLGVIADAIAATRALQEDIRYHILRDAYGPGSPTDLVASSPKNEYEPAAGSPTRD